ncbi:MAG TPA: S9 family peptidase [Pyrinomonadaceae bacterium]|nr:S9 family peptidase [Pyrinomonadaceae bacterium]
MTETDDEILLPPAAKRIPRTTNVHDDALSDDYFWLREKTSAEVLAYLEAENAYTARVMAETEAFRESLYREMLGRIKETDEQVPYRLGDYFYYSRTEEGKQYPIHARRRAAQAEQSPEEVTLDLNQMAEGLQFLSVGDYSVSDDGRLLAYTLDTTGFRDYTLHFKDLRTGESLSGTREKVSSVVWTDDNRTLFYVEDDAAKRPYRLYRHRLGEERDELLYEETDQLFRLEVSRSRSRAYIFAASASFTATEFRYLRTGDRDGAFKIVLPREANHEYYVGHHGESFYLRTNEGGLKNFRLVRAPVEDPRKENWQEIIPHRADVMLEGVDFFSGHFVAHERESGLEKLRITDFGTGEAHYIEFPEPVYSAQAGDNHEFDTRVFRFRYESFITPRSVYDYDMSERERRLLKQTEVLGGYDPSAYASERIYAVASDGTRIPVSLVYKKELRRDGTRPALLYGYGSYGIPMPVGFSSARLSLLERGVVYAIAHIRGGGELGKAWHDAGKLLSKKNTFTDFIASAEHLIAEGYTSPDRLVATGGSAGGLLMGAVVNLRPDLFKAVVSQVPFVDVINSMLDSTLPLTVGEYEEWGNPNEREFYEYMKSYSPYDNLEAKEYPAMLVKTSLNDSQVMYWEPAKYVARLRALKTDQNVLLLKTNMGAGHGGASGRYDFLRETAFDYAFILTQLGINE